jgi:hypothetical protein
MAHTLLITYANLLSPQPRVLLEKLIVTHHLSFQTPSEVLMVVCGLWAEVGESIFLRNIRIGPKYYMAQQPITLPHVPLI